MYIFNLLLGSGSGLGWVRVELELIHHLVVVNCADHDILNPNSVL